MFTAYCFSCDSPVELVNVRTLLWQHVPSGRNTNCWLQALLGVPWFVCGLLQAFRFTSVQ